MNFVEEVVTPLVFVGTNVPQNIDDLSLCYRSFLWF